MIEKQLHRDLRAPKNELTSGEPQPVSGQVATTSTVVLVPPGDIRYGGLTFTPDGNHFITSPTRPAAFSAACTGGPPAPVTRFTSEQIFGYAVSPDQKHLAVVRGHVTSDVVLVSNAQ